MFNLSFYSTMIMLGDGRSVMSTHIGDVQINKWLSLTNILLVPGLNCNLLSVRELCQPGIRVSFDQHVCKITDMKDGQSSLTAENRHGL